MAKKQQRAASAVSLARAIAQTKRWEIFEDPTWFLEDPDSQKLFALIQKRDKTPTLRERIALFKRIQEQLPSECRDLNRLEEAYSALALAHAEAGFLIGLEMARLGGAR